MLKLLLNLALVFVVAALARRVIRGWLRRPEPPKRDAAPRRDKPRSDIGQGQKIEEADYEDLP